MPTDDSDSMRREIAELLEESSKLRQRSDDLAKRIAELKSRIETDCPPPADPKQTD